MITIITKHLIILISFAIIFIGNVCAGKWQLTTFIIEHVLRRN